MFWSSVRYVLKCCLKIFQSSQMHWMLSGGWQLGKQKSQCCVYDLSHGGVSVTNRTDTHHSGFPVSRLTGPVCAEGEEGGLLGKHKAHNQGNSTQSTPCLPPSIVHKNVTRIYFFESQTKSQTRNVNRHQRNKLAYQSTQMKRLHMCHRTSNTKCHRFIP